MRMPEKYDTGAVIAAAGLSSRMKDFKPLLALGDSTVIRTTINKYIQAGCSPVIVVTGKNAALLKEHLKDLPVECVYNPEYETCDMFDSVKLGMEAIKGRCSRFFFSPADIPLVKTDTLIKMINADGPVVKPLFGEKSGHPVLISGELIRPVLEADVPGGLKGALSYALALSGLSEMKLDTDDPGILLDADTPSDYEKIVEAYYHELK